MAEILKLQSKCHSATVPGEQNEKNDKNRTEYLESFGYKVIRYQNADVLNNIDGVFEDLLRKLN